MTNGASTSPSTDPRRFLTPRVAGLKPSGIRKFFDIVATTNDVILGIGEPDFTTSQGPKIIRIRRVHIEEAIGKSTHIMPPGDETAEAAGYSLVNSNHFFRFSKHPFYQPDLRSGIIHSSKREIR